MRKFLIVLLIIGLLAGGILYSKHARSLNDHLIFPFEASDVEGITLYCAGNFSYADVRYQYDLNVYEPRHTGKESYCRGFYETYSTINLRKMSAKDVQKLESQYYNGPYSEVAIQFDLKDGQPYVLIFKAYGIKAGIFQLPDGTSYFSIGNWSADWGDDYVKLE